MEVKFTLYDRKITDYIFGVQSLLLLVFSAFAESFSGEISEHMTFISLIIISLFGYNFFLHRQYYKAIFGWERHSKNIIYFSDHGVVISRNNNKPAITISFEPASHFELYFNGQYSLSNLLGIKMFVPEGVSEINFLYGKEKYSYKFIVVTTDEQITIKNILRAWYKQNLSFKEYVNGEKSHLLETTNQ
jgi:hypothetical protein